MAAKKTKKSTKKTASKKSKKADSAAPKKKTKKKASAQKPKAVDTKKAVTHSKTSGSRKKASKKTATTKTPKPQVNANEAQTVLNTELYQEKVASNQSKEICREVGCDSIASTSHFCRLHYIKNWKKIKRKELLLKEGKLNRYIEELVAKYPDKYIEAIRNDLADNSEFAKVVSDLELTEAIDDFDSDNDSIDSLIDSIRRDVDDDSDVF